MPARRAPPPTAAVPAVAGTAAFSKFMHVLQLVADANEPIGIAALVQASGYPRPTLHRIVAALLAEGLLREGVASGGLQLGPRLIQLASRSWGRSDLRLAAGEALKRLRDLTGETVHLAVPGGTTMVYIEKLESPSAVRMASRIGTSVAMHSSAVGKAYLAALGAAGRETLLARIGEQPMVRHTPNTLTDINSLREQLALVAARGWSSDDEENEIGIACYGAPIFGAAGEPVAAISVSTLRFRQNDKPQQAYIDPLLAACRDISAAIAATPTLAGGDAA